MSLSLSSGLASEKFTVLFFFFFFVSCSSFRSRSISRRHREHFSYDDSRGMLKLREGDCAMSRAYYRAKPKICPAWAAEAGEGGGGKGGSISRRMDNRRGKEFFTPLFLTPGAFRRRWAGKRGERSPTRLTTCRTRMSYFDIGTSYPIRSAWRLFRKRGRTIPWQYSPTSGFVRSPSTTSSPSLLVALFILRTPLQSPCARSLDIGGALSKADFCCCLPRLRTL